MGRIAPTAAVHRRRVDSWESIVHFSHDAESVNTQYGASQRENQVAMDEVCMFGRSVDVDGDEWIDLGLSSDSDDVHQAARDEQSTRQNEDGSAVETANKVAAKPQEVEVIQVDKVEVVELTRTKQPTMVKSAKATQTKATATPASASKAAQSKEALMAFYLGRAKRMEVESKKILVSSTTPVAIRSIRDSGRAPIGL